METHSGGGREHRRGIGFGEGVIEQQLVSSVAFAALGGLLLNLMNLWEEAKIRKARRAPKDALYWVFFCLWPIIGGALGLVYYADGSILRPLASLSLGLGAPATLRSLMSTVTQASGPPENAD